MKCLHSVKLNATPNVEGEVKEAKILSVKDTNCIRLNFPINGKMYKWRCKFDGVYLPDCKSSDSNERNMAKLTRDAIRKMILGKTLKVTCGCIDLDGKLKVDIHVDGQSMIEWLVGNHYVNRV